MPIDEAMTTQREIRVARRLVRLFRIERSGGFARRSNATVQQLLERRGVLIDELLRLEAKRRSFTAWTPAELDLAMVALKLEADRAERSCQALFARLGAELGRLHGASEPTGLRDGAGGQLLGRG